MNEIAKKYHNEYTEITQKGLHQPKDTYIIREDEWTYFKWMTDIDATPNDFEKVKPEIVNLVLNQEFQFLETLVTGERAIMQIMGDETVAVIEPILKKIEMKGN